MWMEGPVLCSHQWLTAQEAYLRSGIDLFWSPKCSVSKRQLAGSSVVGANKDLCSFNLTSCVWLRMRICWNLIKVSTRLCSKEELRLHTGVVTVFGSIQGKQTQADSLTAVHTAVIRLWTKLIYTPECIILHGQQIIRSIILAESELKWNLTIGQHMAPGVQNN